MQGSEAIHEELRRVCWILQALRQIPIKQRWRDKLVSVAGEEEVPMDDKANLLDVVGLVCDALAVDGVKIRESGDELEIVFRGELRGVEMDNEEADFGYGCPALGELKESCAVGGGADVDGPGGRPARHERIGFGVLSLNVHLVDILRLISEISWW